MSIDISDRERVMGKPPGGYRAADTDRRVRWVESHTGLRLDELPGLEPDELRGIIESHVGYVPLPMSIAAPLMVEGAYAQGEFAVPLCTVEGTLTLSMTRGLLAMAMGGGCRAQHYRQELSRSPAFALSSIHDIPEFVERVREDHDDIRRAAESTTRHGRLLRIDPVPIQGWVVLDFIYDTGNAAGQNMVTIATDAACRLIRERTGREYLLESGLTSDKKPSHRNLMIGRGHGVMVETDLSGQVLEFLGVTAEAILRFQELATTTAQAAGLLGNNLHLSNALTAIYLATGQDAACAAENAVAFSQATPHGDGLRCRMTLPSLTVGTVGGGTRLPAQRRNLELLGCHEGRYAARKLAEIVGVAALALEISLLAAVVSGTFAHAHATYGRPGRDA